MNNSMSGNPVAKPVNKDGFRYEFKKNKALFAMIAPATIFVFIMLYVPMAGLVLAFKSYRYDLGIFKSPWNGLGNFKYLFNSGTGWLITRNTILYNLLNKHFKKVSQTLILLPYFISWVVVGVFVFALFNYENGFINGIITSLGGEKVNFYMMPGAWPWIICAFNAWKWTGYNSVIYIAAITGVDAEINEAAAIDGATISQRIRGRTNSSR